MRDLANHRFIFHTTSYLTSSLFLLLLVMILLPLIGFPGVANSADEEKQILPMMVAKVRGDLTIDGPASTPTYTAYFHIPVPTENQVPLIVNVTGDRLINYRIIRTTGQNVLVAAEMHSALSTTLSWEAWVLIKRNFFSDLPVATLMPVFEDLPDSVQPYLQATATAQVDCAPVQQWASENSNFYFMADAAQAVCDRCWEIPFQYSHYPLSFDAFFALTWGSSCTGHAHAATALLRALGIPARTKLAMITWFHLGSVINPC